MCVCLVTPSRPTLRDPMDCSSPGSSVHGESPSKNTRVGCHALLQGIFPTQGSKPFPRGSPGKKHGYRCLARMLLAHPVAERTRVWAGHDDTSSSSAVSHGSRHRPPGQGVLSWPVMAASPSWEGGPSLHCIGNQQSFHCQSLFP